MDPQIAVALIAAAGIVAAAWITGRATHKRVKDIQSEFSTNHGTSMKDALNRIETGLNNVRGDVAHLTGRFDQHLDDITAARREGTQMWSAVEAVANATPPDQGEHA